MTSAVFLEAWRRRDQVDLVGAPALPWLLGVANNLLRNHRRSLRRASAALARFHENVTAPDFGDNLADRLDAERRMRAIREEIAGLPVHEREALELCAWAGLSYADAARAVGVPVGTMRSRLSRARARLAELVGDEVARRAQQALLLRPEPGLPVARRGSGEQRRGQVSAGAAPAGLVGTVRWWPTSLPESCS